MSTNRQAVVELMKQAAHRGATEIVMKVPRRPMLRINGRLVPTRGPHLTPQDTLDVSFALCSMASLELPLATMTDHEHSIGLTGVGRFRVHLYRQRGSLAVVIQRLESGVPTLEELGASSEASQLVVTPGITLVVGKRREALRGALVGHYNGQHFGHVVSLEQRITFLHRDDVASVAQREVGNDVGDFASGIRHAIRAGVDLLAVGDVDDTVTATAVLEAAEVGLPVLATVAAPRIEVGTWWILRMFGLDLQPVVEKRLSMSLVAIAELNETYRCSPSSAPIVGPA